MTRAVQTGAGAASPAVAETGAAARSWTPTRVGLGVALLAGAVLATIDAWRDIAHIAWVDEESSHIFLVPLIAGWLAWARKDEIERTPPNYSLLGPSVILLGGLLNAYGFYGNIQALWHGGAVLVAVGAFVTVAGARLAWVLLPALAVLAFLVPVPGMVRQEIAIPMQTWTAAITAFLYDLFAVPIERSGNILRFNGADVAVAEACNGMRMVFALILVTYAVAFATPLRGYVRVLLLALSPVFAVACNVIRLLPTVYAYGQSKAAGDVLHNVGGWVMIGVAFAMVLGLINLLRWAELPVMQPGHDGEEETA